MTSLANTIEFIAGRRAGLSDCEIAEAIYGERTQQLVNGECRYLERAGKLERRPRADGIIGNYLPSQS
ncbi:MULTISPECIES: hypothetical protein [unclassified Mesorhizobium]|uniref:hypothetical protein n=1 Tax=unclassified Mesorhizobium TaxID=325217 RepID=UPI0033379026